MKKERKGILNIRTMLVVFKILILRICHSISAVVNYVTDPYLSLSYSSKPVLKSKMVLFKCQTGKSYVAE